MLDTIISLIGGGFAALILYFWFMEMEEDRDRLKRIEKKLRSQDE